MSFHKLKLGARKKDQGKSASSVKQQKIKNVEMLDFHIEHKLHPKKSIIAMNDNLMSQAFNLKKVDLFSGSKTERTNKVEKFDVSEYSVAANKKNTKQNEYFFNYSNSEQNQQYSAIDLINFLSNRPSENKRSEQISVRQQKRLVQNIEDKFPQNLSKSQPKQAHHQLKILNFESASNKNGPSQVQIKQKKTIQLDQKPLNYQHTKNQEIQTEPHVQTRIIAQNVFSKQAYPSNLAQIKFINAQALQQIVAAQKLQQSKTDECQIEISKIEVIETDKIEANITQANEVQTDLVQTDLVQTDLGQTDLVQTCLTQINLVPTDDTKKEIENRIRSSLQVQSGATFQSVPSNLQRAQCKFLQQRLVIQKQQREIQQKAQTQQKREQSSQIVSNQNQISLSQKTPHKIQKYELSPTKSKLSYKPINQIELTIIQQNKSLTQEVQKLRKQRDQLLFCNKRYEVQLLQNDCKEYYEREIARLQKQVQTLQCSHEEFKHLNFMLQNKNKELESSDELNKKQMKKLLKQLQLLKIGSTKEKYQLKEKGTSLQTIIKQLEERNADLSNKFEDYYKKYQELQKEFKDKCQEQLNVRKLYQNLQSRIMSSERTNFQKIKHYQHQIQRLSNENIDISDNFRNFRRQSESQMQNLRQNVKQLNLKRQSQALLISSRIKSIQKHNNLVQAELNVVRLQQTVKQLTTQIQKRSDLIRQLNNKIDSMISMDDYEDLRKQLETVCENKVTITQQYQQQILYLNKQIQQFKKKLQQNQKQLKQNQNFVDNANKKGSSLKNDSISQKQNFKQILKKQITECDALKQEVFSKSQQLFQSKQQNQQLRAERESLKNEQDILKKKYSSYQNNSKIKKQILQQEMVNEVQSVKRKFTVLQKRFQSKVKENKQKQQFIQNYIVGKSSNQSDAQYLIKQLQRIFLQKQKLSTH